MVNSKFRLEVSYHETTGEPVAAYLRIREGKVAETKEVSEGVAFADYGADGSLLGVELLAPCRIDVLDRISEKEPEAVRRFLRRGVCRYPLKEDEMPRRLYLRDVADRWAREVAAAEGTVKLFFPFITTEAVDYVLRARQPGTVRCEVYTLFKPHHFASGASSLDALERLQKWGATLFALPRLHAKVLIVPGHFASVGSQNLTGQGRRNREATIAFTGPQTVARIERLTNRWAVEAVPISSEDLQQVKDAIGPLRELHRRLKMEAKSLTSQLKHVMSLRKHTEERKGQASAEVSEIILPTEVMGRIAPPVQAPVPPTTTNVPLATLAPSGHPEAIPSISGDQKQDRLGEDTYVTIWEFARLSLPQGHQSESEIRELASRILNFLCPGRSSWGAKRPGYSQAHISQQDYNTIETEFGRNEYVRYRWSITDAWVDFNTKRLKVQAVDLERYLGDWMFEPDRQYKPRRNERDEWIKMWKIV